MTKIIAVANQKGGVGKTTTSVNLATSLAVIKRKVLIIDMDPQGNATTGVGLDKHNMPVFLSDVLLGDAQVEAALQKVPNTNIEALAGGPDLTIAEFQMMKMDDREYCLHNVLAGIKNRYDYIIIDCPPSLNMLTVHEISNDALDGVPILVTYCPLCNAGVVYDRRVKIDGKDKELNFKVSGMLRKSDMVMMDEETETLWQQLMGEAIVGDYTGTFLRVIPSLIVSVEEFFERYPDGWIIDPQKADKESQEVYGTNYYVGYDKSDSKPYERFFDAEDVDSRLPAMERVIDIQVDGKYKIYPLSILADKQVIHDEFNGVKVVLFYQQGTVSILDAKEIRNSKAIGTSTVFSPILDRQELSFTKKGGYFVDEQTGSKWDITGISVEGKLMGKQLSIEPHSNHFAFAWLGFFPDSEIYGE